MVKYDEYKGNPLIILMREEDDRFRLSFGLTKAKLILSHIEEIKKFVEKHEPPSGDRDDNPDANETAS